ncbi:DUF5324 family protein [Streptomyces sp. NPDC006879]|uniref:DUF5324 family protein n=1 Tax=Streptomyces sp. NPDC006879 TaxID=3364767 RepID=UPI00369FF554
MSRKDSVRTAAGTAKDGVLHAAEVVAPYAATARDSAVHYAQEARDRLGPPMSQAAAQAARQVRSQYEEHLAARVEQARCHVPPKVDRAAREAVLRTRKAAQQAADYAGPRVESAVAAAQPVAEEAAARSVAAVAALRGQVSAKEVKRLIRRHERRAAYGRALRVTALAVVVAAGAVAAWKWWDRQANPDWLVEPPAATEVSERSPLSSVDGSGPAERQDREAGAAEEDGHG